MASMSLMGAGFLLNPKHAILNLILLSWLNFSGLYLIYRLNDFIDAQPDLKLNLRQFFADKKHKLLTAQLFFLAIPLACFVLDLFSLIILGAASLTGLLYSIQFRMGKISFRLKNVFLLKNILIGSVWGALVLVGYGAEPTVEVWRLFLFVSVQVVIGSMIRDIPDIIEDRAEGVHSLPVILGKPVTFVFMHLLNVSSGFVCLIPDLSVKWVALASVVVFWRFINLVFVAKNPANAFWTQKINLMTCVLIMLVISVQVVYSYYAK